VHQIQRLTILPASVSITILQICVAFYVASMLDLLVQPLVDYKEFALTICVGVTSLSLVYRMRMDVRSRLATEEKLKTFDVRACDCACEADRPVVEGSIAMLMKACQLVDPLATHDGALDAFNDAIKLILPRALVACVWWPLAFRFYCGVCGR